MSGPPHVALAWSFLDAEKDKSIVVPASMMLRYTDHRTGEVRVLEPRPGLRSKAYRSRRQMSKATSIPADTFRSWADRLIGRRWMERTAEGWAWTAAGYQEITGRKLLDPTVGVSTPTVGVSTPTSGVSTPTSGVSTPTSGVSTPTTQPVTWENGPLTSSTSSTNSTKGSSFAIEVLTEAATRWGLDEAQRRELFSPENVGRVQDAVDELERDGRMDPEVFRRQVTTPTNERVRNVSAVVVRTVQRAKMDSREATEGRRRLTGVTQEVPPADEYDVSDEPF